MERILGSPKISSMLKVEEEVVRERVLEMRSGDLRGTGAVRLRKTKHTGAESVQEESMGRLREIIEPGRPQLK